MSNPCAVAITERREGWNPISHGPTSLTVVHVVAGRLVITGWAWLCDKHQRPDVLTPDAFEATSIQRVRD